MGGVSLTGTKQLESEMSMKQHLNEITYPQQDAIAIVSDLVANIPGMTLLGFDKPEHPWTSNRRGRKTLSEIDVADSYAPEVISWLKTILKQEEIREGFLYYFRLFSAHHGLWVKANFDPSGNWVEPLWNLSKSEMLFVNLTETYYLEIYDDEGSHIAEIRSRDEDASYPETFDLSSEQITSIRRLDQYYALSGDTNGDAFLWRIPDKKIVRVFQGYGEYAFNAVRIVDSLAVSETKSNVLHLWDISDGQIVRGTKRYREVSSIGHFMSVDENHVLTAFRERPGGIALWNIPTGEIVKVFGLEFYTEDFVQIRKDHILSACYEGLLQLWDVSNEKLIRDFGGHEGPIRSLLKVDSDTVLSCSWDKTLRWWNITTGESRQLLKLDYPLHGLAGMGNGCFTVSGSIVPSTYQLDWWDLQTLDNLARVNISAPSYNVERLEILDNDTLVIQFGDAVQVVNIVHSAAGGPSLDLIGKVRPEEPLD